MPTLVVIVALFGMGLLIAADYADHHGRPGRARIYQALGYVNLVVALAGGIVYVATTG